MVQKVGCISQFIGMVSFGVYLPSGGKDGWGILVEDGMKKGWLGFINDFMVW